MLNKQPEQDFHPIQPDEPKLTENEVEAEMDWRLETLFNDCHEQALASLAQYVGRNAMEVAAMLVTYDDTGECASAESLIRKYRAEFLDFARHAQAFDYIRAEVEES
jgi:hypothetical protein